MAKDSVEDETALPTSENDDAEVVAIPIANGAANSEPLLEVLEE